jgi:hypothetical protein
MTPTPKEKAKELLWKYLPILESWKVDDSSKAKQCALIAVNEIVKNGFNPQLPYNYWEEVKEEIEKL